MSKGQLKSLEMEAFCDNIAMMMSVGVQTSEASYMLSENAETALLARKSKEVYDLLARGSKLSAAMSEVGGFPEYAINMVASGERTGKTQETLQNLAVYYAEEARLVNKIKQSVSYPAAILSIMAVVLAFVAGGILPVFFDVYKTMAGGLVDSSLAYVNIGLLIGWIALGLTLLGALVAIIAAAAANTAGGRDRLLRMLSHFPGGKKVMYDLALSRMTSTLSVYMASGINSDDALRQSIPSIDDKRLRSRAEQALAQMTDPRDPRSLVQALAESDVLDAMRSRMLSFGLRSGRAEEVLSDMSEDLMDDSIEGLDRLIDKIEPALAGLVTVAVALTLIAVMLPLVGMVGSMA